MQHHVFRSFRRKKKKSSHGTRSQGSQEGMTDIVQMEELEEAERQAAKPAWRTRAFWQSAIPLFVSVVLLTVGTVLATKHYQKQVCCRQTYCGSSWCTSRTACLLIKCCMSACAAAQHVCFVSAPSGMSFQSAVVTTWFSTQKLTSCCNQQYAEQFCAWH